MFVKAGSASTHATSSGARASANASTSLNSTTLVVSVGSTAAPIEPGRATTEPSSLNTAKVSSTVPW